MKQTPLLAVHRALGAKTIEFGGWDMPVQYGPILDEVRCVREKVGLFDLSHMGRVRVTGPERVAFLDRVVTNHVAKIPRGSIRYALLCKEDGNPIDDLLVYRDEDEVLLVVNAANHDVDMAWLAEHARGFDVTIDDLTAELAMIALQGPASRAVLERVCDLDLETLRYYRFARGTLCGMPDTFVSRTGYTGELGYELYVPAAEAERVWRELTAAGEPEGLRPIGLGARDTLRLEAGLALYGHEIDAEHNPIEAGLDFAVSFDEAKGDWIGRAALERVRKAPRRKLVGLTSDGPRIPRQGQELIVASDGAGDVVGTVCSGSRSPTLDTNIATAYVPVSLEHGTAVEIDFRGKRQTAVVRPLPFYSRTRT
jgi:aminomethyltransferase